MQASYLLRPEELDENFLNMIKQTFKNKVIKIAISDDVAPPPVRRAGVLQGKIDIAPDFDAPLGDFDEYQR